MAAEFADVRWSDGRDSLVLSPRHGGRVLSWVHDGQERVTAPFKLEGGALRVLFGEERYPGASYLAPCEVVSREEGADGFRVHLRHYWNAPNWLLRAFGWPGKAALLHLDGLLLDCVVTFTAAQHCLVADMTVRNLTSETKYCSPWLHNSFTRWAAELFMVEDGARTPFTDTDIYWGSHVSRPGCALRAVLADAAGTTFAVLGAAPELLAGMYGESVSAQAPPDGFAQGCFELRYDGLKLAPGQQWHGNAFVAFTGDWRQWATGAPVPLFSRIEDAPATPYEPSYLLSALETWMLPSEAEQGLMTLSYLDKAPFSSADRYDAAHAFAGFHADGDGVRAQVILYASRELSDLRAELTAPAGWRLTLDGDPAERFALARGQHAVLALHGPADLAGREAVSVRLTGAGETRLTVPKAAAVEPAYPYLVKQFPQYMGERWAFERGPFTGAIAAEFLDWKARMRDRLHRHLAASITRPCDLAPRLVERQVGPTCVREKVMIQTEPGIWQPGYVIYAKEAAGNLPIVIYYHGSGPGKQGFAGDEDPAFPRSEPQHDMEYLPYRLAADLGYLVYVPDMRWQGELAETNPSQYTWRYQGYGVDQTAVYAWDMLRQLDYLCARPDTDPARIGAYGSSGGGNATALLSLLDERVRTGIISSTAIYYPHDDVLPAGYFQHMRDTAPPMPMPAPRSPLTGATACMLLAPRPMWIMDGVDDAPPAAREAFHCRADAGRAEIARAYQLLGAEDRFRASWFDGGHCAGMTYENITAWFRRWL